MQAKYRWLLLPPALALVLFIGPLSQPEAPAKSAPAEVETAANPETAEPQIASGPELPSIGQVASTLIGVLLLGAAGIFVFARMQGRRRSPAGNLMELRQTIRISGRHSVHAVQFEDALLLLGECDGNLSVLQRGPDAGAAIDENRIAQRSEEEDDDDGAVPRNLVIPRPQGSPNRTMKAAATARPADFQALLKLARRES